MGKKGKIGKQRKDKYYHLAKEAGYRSRAAFKLIQLNKRFEFLQRSRAVVDLCAAPGGWLQVASQNMPVSSLRIGVDLVPIKAIPKCITIQGDITAEKTRHLVKKELQTWEADCVLHDGAPNVGLNWAHDAFQQNCLTLFALRLATQILRKNGYFVTKIFRSSDYQQLVAVFEKLFKRVHVWKPAASRLESAEIFVVCERYLKPAKVDSDLLDVKKVFQQQPDDIINPLRLLNTRKKQKKAKAEGYAENDITQFHELKASDFLHSSEALLHLSQSSCIVLDSATSEESPYTSPEIRECIKDIKVCGPAELRNILMWRKKILAELKKEAKLNAKAGDKDEEKVEPKETAEEKEIREIDELIQNAQAAEKSKLRKKKKKLLKEKAKLLERKRLQMDHEGDVPTLSEDIELFSLATIRRFLERRKNNEQQMKSALDAKKEEEDDDEEYVSGDDDDGATAQKSLNDDSNWETLEGNNVNYDSDHDMQDDEERNVLEQDLIHDEETYMTETEKTESRSEKWLSKISSLLPDDDEEVENLDIIAKHMKGKMNKSKLHKNTVSFDIPQKPNNLNENDDDDDMGESEDEEYEDIVNGQYVKKRKADFIKHEAEKEAKKAKRLTPEQLAMGELMIYSSKTRKDLEDWGWNRFSNNDTGLPDWFVDDEKNHCQKILPITKERIDFYKQRQKELNVRPIKKVVEAKARKQRRQMRKLAKAKKRAENILENDSMEHREKVKEMKKVYKKALTSDKKDVKYQVMTKGKRGKLSRPGGPFKVVDRRLKKDKRKEKAKNKKESGKNKPRNKRTRK